MTDRSASQRGVPTWRTTARGCLPHRSTKGTQSTTTRSLWCGETRRRSLTSLVSRRTKKPPSAPPSALVLWPDPEAEAQLLELVDSFDVYRPHAFGRGGPFASPQQRTPGSVTRRPFAPPAPP